MLTFCLFSPTSTHSTHFVTCTSIPLLHSLHSSPTGSKLGLIPSCQNLSNLFHNLVFAPSFMNICVISIHNEKNVWAQSFQFTMKFFFEHSYQSDFWIFIRISNNNISVFVFPFETSFSWTLIFKYFLLFSGHSLASICTSVILQKSQFINIQTGKNLGK